MATELNRLTARFVETCFTPGKYRDGGNLLLIVGNGGSKNWAFVYKFNGRQREAGLGSLTKVSLKNARALAADFRALLGEGVDPLEKRKEDAARAAENAVAFAAREASASFGAFALELLNGYSEKDAKGREKRIPGLVAGFRNAKHAQQWENTLRDYAKPIWDMKLEAIDVEHVLRCVAPIWTSKNETARRVRGRIEAVLTAAIAKRRRSAPNPAVLKGNLEALLPRVRKLQRGHHPALGWRDAQSFWTKLEPLTSISASALKFTILTAARSGETRGATWGELDLENSTWTVPGHRMKAGKPHTVPLSDLALSLIDDLKPQRRSGEPDELIFPSVRDRKPLSDMALLMCCRGVWDGVTPHGFRSTFRDWCGDSTSYPRELAEQALAHTVGGVEGAYRRSDALSKRRAMMADWANFLVSKRTNNVIEISPNKNSAA